MSDKVKVKMTATCNITLNKTASMSKEDFQQYEHLISDDSQLSARESYLAINHLAEVYGLSESGNDTDWGELEDVNIEVSEET